MIFIELTTPEGEKKTIQAETIAEMKNGGLGHTYIKFTDTGRNAYFSESIAEILQKIKDAEAGPAESCGADYCEIFKETPGIPKQEDPGTIDALLFAAAEITRICEKSTCTNCPIKAKTAICPFSGVPTDWPIHNWEDYK